MDAHDSPSSGEAIAGERGGLPGAAGAGSSSDGGGFLDLESRRHAPGVSRAPLAPVTSPEGLPGPLPAAADAPPVALAAPRRTGRPSACWSCGTGTPAGRTFCTQCGAPLRCRTPTGPSAGQPAGLPDTASVPCHTNVRGEEPIVSPVGHLS